MATVKRSRVLVGAAAIVFLIEGSEAFVVPSGLATQRNFVPKTGITDEQHEQHQQRLVWKPLRSFQFIKGETSYGDMAEGSTMNGMLGGPTLVGGGNSLLRGSRQARRGVGRTSWWTSLSNFSQKTPTTLLAAGSLESWPVMEADDIQILVGVDTEKADSESDSKKVKATLERWERDISLEVVGYDNPMLGNQMQPNSNGQDRCTQSIKFDVANGDVYPFSGTISVPPPLTVEDSTGNKQTVMMVLNNPDEDDGDGILDYDEYGNMIESPKPAPIEAKLEPIFKSPDEKYAEAQQQQQQQQQLQYDEYGNEIYNPQDQYGEQKTSIPSNGSQFFQLDPTDPASGKIKISLEREEGGGGFGGVFGGGSGGSSSEARVEIYHGFRDQYGNSYNSNYDGDEEDRRISLEVSTMHPSFSSVVDTMPANLLAKHALPSVNDLSSVEPYLEVRIVNTGGASLKAGVQSFLPQYRPQTRQQRERRNFERQTYEKRQLGQPSSQPIGASVKADDPFLLVDSAQSTTNARRMNTNSFGQQQREPTYVRANSASASSSWGSSGGGPSINTMWSTGDPESRRSASSYGGPIGNSGGMIANTPGANLGGQFVRADTRNQSPVIRSRVNPAYWDAIDTTATEKRSSRGLVANNDFTKANGSRETTGIIPGSKKNSAVGSGVRRVSASSTSLQSFGGNSGGTNGMQQPYQQQQQSFQQRQQSFRGNTGGSGIQEAFPLQTSPQRTRNLQGQPQQRATSVYAGNGGVIGNGVIAGRPASTTSAFRDKRMPNNSEEFTSSGRNGGFQPQRSNTGYNRGQSSTSSFTPPPSNTFGGGNSNIMGNEAQANNFMGSMKQRVEENDSWTRGNNNNQQQQQKSNNGGFLKNPFGGNKNKNNQQSRNNNSFGGNNNGFGSSNSNNAGGFGGPGNSNSNNNFQSNGENPFGKMGKPPQTMGNIKNPFGGNSMKNNQQNGGTRVGNKFGGNNGFGGANNNSQQNGGNRGGNKFGGNNGFGGANNNSQQNGGNRGGNKFGGNNGFGGANNNIQQIGGNRGGNKFGGSKNGFGGANNNKQQNGGISGGNKFGGSKNGFGGANNNSQQIGGNRGGNKFGGNNGFGGANNNNQQNGGFSGGNKFGGSKNGFGGASNNNQQIGGNGGGNKFGRSKNGFGGANNNNNNSGRFGGSGNGNSNSNFQANGGSPFGNMGKPPQTMANSKNPFANLNGDTSQQSMSNSNNNFNSNSNSNFGNNNSNKNNNVFGGGAGGGAPQRPLSPSPNAMKNPFAGLNGKANNGPGGSTTAMRSASTDESSNENPIMGFAKSLVKGIGDYGGSKNKSEDDYYR